ncbi:putative ankyrin repeat protein RF_0381 [Belonocnema kinseyi]|uniref:putative ankyrin repeat protein RF_0381 n=1 Tax=Belonocnema kinseyi TaxID=2817044 RepID=UPI00143D2A73|nr:putative ankyrin repeat protein RF_0381 [Belonocnema kinseyi]
MSFLSESETIVIKRSCEDLRNWLLTQGDLNIPNKQNGTFLVQWALLIGDIEKVQLLLQNGADANFHSDEFDKLFVSHEETIKFLIEEASAFNIVRTNFSTVLQFLILDSEEMFFKLINSGTFFDINARNPYGSTLLHIAIHTEKMKIVEKLVDCGAHLKINSLVHNTPLNCAISVNNTRIVRFLLDRGAPLNCRGLRQYTPLHQAVAVKNLGIVKLLVSRKANVDAKDFEDKTPLRVIDSPSNYREEFQYLPPEAVLLDEADLQNRIAILRFLLKNSADLSI